MKRTDFSYKLPEDQIAVYPAAERSASRLLVWDPSAGVHHHRLFSDLPHWLSQNDLLVLNDTRVQNARLFGQKSTGGHVEVLIERLWPDGSATAMIRASKAPKVGAVLRVGEEELLVTHVEKPIYGVKGITSSVSEVMARYGHVPLPPYINRPDTAEDRKRYQTVYAKTSGSAAAPTAGLHFDQALLQRLRAQGISTAYLTLHVGLGTFAPIRVENLAEHNMHAEWFEVPQSVCEAIAQTRDRGGRVVAVGTTTLRALETAAAAQSLSESNAKGLLPYQGESRLFITPGFRFRVVDALVTNFHLPESTLLMLVSAFAGHEQTLSMYREAVNNGYRFFSFGDAMLISSCVTATESRAG
ncbi:MAG: tRNA preQ1(34) S-adenosylmethionine ribosyltransferase-isomerase QueA [Gammaproteobacteria bacterium]